MKGIIILIISFCFIFSIYAYTPTNSTDISLVFDKDYTPTDSADVILVFADTGDANQCSCPTSGDWEILCSSNCTITENCNIDTATLYLEGEGIIGLESNITVNKIIWNKDCSVDKKNEFDILFKK